MERYFIGIFEIVLENLEIIGIFYRANVYHSGRRNSGNKGNGLEVRYGGRMKERNGMHGWERR